MKEDAEKALSVLIEQPEVDKSKGITVIGHSEGTIIAPRVAIDNPDKVSNLVLMGAQAENIKEASYFQSVTLPVLYAQNVLDHSHDGLLSVNEATHNPVFQSMFGGNFTLFLIQENITAFNNLSTSPDNKDVSVNGTTTIFNDLMQDDNDDNSNVTTKTNQKENYELAPGNLPDLSPHQCRADGLGRAHLAQKWAHFSCGQLPRQ